MKKILFMIGIVFLLTSHGHTSNVDHLFHDLVKQFRSFSPTSIFPSKIPEVSHLQNWLEDQAHNKWQSFNSQPSAIPEKKRDFLDNLSAIVTHKNAVIAALWLIKNPDSLTSQDSHFFENLLLYSSFKAAWFNECTSFTNQAYYIAQSISPDQLKQRWNKAIQEARSLQLIEDLFISLESSTKIITVFVFYKKESIQPRYNLINQLAKNMSIHNKQRIFASSLFFSEAELKQKLDTLQKNREIFKKDLSEEAQSRIISACLGCLYLQDLSDMLRQINESKGLMRIYTPSAYAEIVNACLNLSPDQLRILLNHADSILGHLSSSVERAQVITMIQRLSLEQTQVLTHRINKRTLFSSHTNIQQTKSTLQTISDLSPTDIKKIFTSADIFSSVLETTPVQNE